MFSQCWLHSLSLIDVLGMHDSVFLEALRHTVHFTRHYGFASVKAILAQQMIAATNPTISSTYPNHTSWQTPTKLYRFTSLIVALEENPRLISGGT